MGNWGRISAILIVFSATCSCGDEVPANESLKDYPDPLIVYDDSNEQRAAVSPANTQTTNDIARFAEFECVANAPVSTTGIPSRTGDRFENGETLNVIYYEPTNVNVFGLQARALERFRSDSGNNGVAVYVAAERATIFNAILARYPDARTSGDTVESPAMGGFISLQPAENEWIRIACLSRGPVAVQ